MDKSEYHRYLASREWALLKEQVKKRSDGICERCHIGDHSNTHHLTYENIGHESPKDLQGVCEPCHKFLSGKIDQDPVYIISRAKQFVMATECRILLTFMSELIREIGVEEVGDGRLAQLFCELEDFLKVIEEKTLGNGVEKFTKDLAEGRVTELIQFIKSCVNGESAIRERPPQDCK